MDFSYDSTITHARSDGFEAVIGMSSVNQQLSINQLITAAITLDGGLDEADRIFGSALFADDPRIHKVWCEIPLHPLQQQFPNGDRHVIRNSPLFEVFLSDFQKYYYCYYNYYYYYYYYCHYYNNNYYHHYYYFIIIINILLIFLASYYDSCFLSVNFFISAFFTLTNCFFNFFLLVL